MEDKPASLLVPSGKTLRGIALFPCGKWMTGNAKVSSL